MTSHTTFELEAAIANRKDERAAGDHAHQFPESLLEHLAATRSSHRQRLQPSAGDLLASGTISGPTEDSRGCMLELTWRGANPLQLPERRESQMARRRRSPDHYRLVRRRWLSHRVRRGHRQDSRGLTINFCNYRNRGACKQKKRSDSEYKHEETRRK